MIEEIHGEYKPEVKPSSRRCQVVVIGAGLSGLSAAKWLDDAGVDVLVLEAQGRVGGRTYSKKVPVAGVEYVELGGAFLCPGQNHLLRLAREMGVEKYAIDEGTGSTVFYDATSGRRRLFPRGREPRIWNPIVLLDINNFFRSLDEFCDEIPSHAPWEAPRAKEWDRMTVKEYADKVIWTETMRDILRSFHNVRMASHPYEASLLWFLWDIKHNRGIKKLLSTFGAEKWKFVGGAMQISERIVERLGGDARVLLKKPVVGLRQDDSDGGSVTVTTLDGSSYTADYAILATPPVVQQKLHFEPPMPAIRNQLIQRVPMGSVVKIVIFYETSFWFDLGLSGEVVIDGGERDDDFPINFTMDGTRPDGSNSSLIGFIWTDKARRLLVATNRNDRMRLIARSLAETFDDDRFLKPTLYDEFDWSEDQYSGGCYNMVLQPGFLTTYGGALREPIGRLFFAATETAVDWGGHMNGAISAGERAAREVLHAMGKIAADQIWIEEPDFKEDGTNEHIPFTVFERILPSVASLTYSYVQHVGRRTRNGSGDEM